MNRHSAQPHTGFTLIEAVIALLLLGIVSVTIIKLNGQLFSNDKNLSTWQSDTQLLQACVDRMIGLRKNGKSFSSYATDSTCYGLYPLSTSRVTVKVSTLASCPTPTASPASGAQCKQLDIQATGIGSTVSMLIADY